MAQVLELFDQADQAVAERRLTSPVDRSAWHYYRQILTLVPDNLEARQGLVNVVERYIQWSDAALRQGRVGQARQYLERGAQVLPQHPPLQERMAQLRSRPSTSEHYIGLDADALEGRTDALREQLANAAEQIRRHDARVVIEAPSDRAGRWLYQQLNSRHEEYRIRANLRLQQRPGLRLIY
ncbi:tetratricopeptide repeat protein [Motiliproteus sp. SC1-56]|uniref:tetratricopeptide repeat protein n=1 Tax=Motiliproteus sp. SC1-56 TaxID=2799565 RepID=UPI001A9022C1|nr:tetratricopeptide repeat protein [Motiliproteus sp. SC1-56]